MITALNSVNNPLTGSPAVSDSLSLMKGPGTRSVGETEPFGDLLKGAVEQVNQLDAQAQTAVTGLMTGTGVDVHQAMIASEKASMAFEMVLAVRNKAVQSYQSVMSMQF